MAATLELRVLQALSKALQADQLVLPTLPEVALKAREAAQDPNATAVKLAKVVGNDAAMSARLIKVANSPLLRAARAIEDLTGAITRIGITFASNLITGFAMQQMYQATSDLVDKKMREIWTLSATVGGVAHVLCRQYTKLKPDQATLAGIIHQIGALPVLTFAEDFPDLLSDEETLNRIVEQMHPQIGEAILQAWDFPPELIPVPGHYLNLQRKGGEKADYVDLVTVASMYVNSGKDNAMGSADWENVAALKRLGIKDKAELDALADTMKAAASTFA
ncbi:MAG TPA: HDOD domain-containing protein [Pseudomonadales bacterium]|nr:HDOD domain-containing protein [Pseudomonadales bacterium]